MNAGSALTFGHEVLVDAYRVKLVAARQGAFEVPVFDEFRAAKAAA